MRRTILYVMIWAILVAGTITEVATRFLPFAISIVIFGIISISSIKALLIALYYQHLRDEAIIVSLFLVTALTIIATLLIGSVAGGG